MDKSVTEDIKEEKVEEPMGEEVEETEETKPVEEEKKEAPKTESESDTKAEVKRLLEHSCESVRYFEYDDARKILEKVSEHLSDLTGDPEYPMLEMRFLLYRGRINWIVGKWSQALVDFKQIIDMKDQVEDTKLVVEAHLANGEIFGNRGNYRGAVDTLKDGLSLADKKNDVMQIARACCSLGKFYSRIGEASTGRRLLERGKNISEEHSDVKGMQPVMAAINNQIGLGHFRNKELEKAQYHFQETIELMEEDPYSFERAEALRYMGITRSIQGENKSALEYHSEALWVYLQTGFKIGQAKVYNSIGQTCLSLSRLNEAIYFMEKAERICRELEADAEAATIYGKLGNVYMIKEEYDKAERYFTRDLEMCKKFGNVRAMAFSCANLGECSIYLGKSRQAADFLNQSLELFRKVSDPVNEQRVLLLLAKTQINNGNLEEAQGIIDKLSEKIPPRERSLDSGTLQMLKGVIKRHEKNWAEASSHLNQSIEIFKSKGKSVHLAEAYYEYGLLGLGINDREGALAKFEEAFRIARELNLSRQRQRYFKIIERIDEREIVKMILEELDQATA